MMVNCHTCDKLAIDGYCNNDLKSQTHIRKFHKKHEINYTTS